MRLIICYDEDEHPITEGVSASDLARKLGVTPGAVLHGLRRGSKKYEEIEVDDLEEEE